MLEDEYVKSLGKLDEMGKKVIWSTCISGSQIRKLFYNFKELYFEKTTITADKILSEKATEKMEMGKIMEGVIRERAKEKFHLDIQYTPDTYALKANPFFTANIDGYIKNENDELEIIEIKNTEEMDIEKVYEYYKYQIQYYMWFFNAVKGRLIILSNGWKLQMKEVERDEALEFQIVERCNALCSMIKDQNTDNKFFNSEKEEETTDSVIKYLDNTEPAYEQLRQLVELKAKSKELEAEIEGLENELKEYAQGDKKVILVSENNQYALTTIVKKGNIKYKEYFKDKGIAESELEQYRGENSTYVKGVLTTLN